MPDEPPSDCGAAAPCCVEDSGSGPVLSVLHVDFQEVFRGAENQLLLLHEGLIHRGVMSMVLAFAGSGLYHQACRRRLPNIFVVPSRRWHLGELDPWALFGLLAACRRYQPAVVHAHSAHAAGVVYLAKPWLPDSLKIVFHRTVTDPLGFFSRHKYNAADRIISVSQEGKRRLLERGVREDKITVIAAGLTLTPGSRRAPRDKDKNFFTIGSLAALDRTQKDVATLIHAAARARQELPHLRVSIFGDGPDRGALEALTDRLNLRSQVTFHGWWHGPLEDALSELDVFILPSFKEGTSNVLIAAMALGLPCIATRIPGNEEVLGDCGMLFEVGNPMALAQAIAQLERSSALRETLAHKALERSRFFSFERSLKATMAAYEELSAL